MENKARLLGSKKSKWIISISAILIGIMSVFAVWGLLIYKPASLTCKVEYIKEIGDIIVQTYLKGEKLSFPDTPTKSGYDFVGWSLDENENNFITTEIVVDKELTLYAKWQEKEYELLFNDVKLKVDYSTSLYLNENNVCIETNGETTTFTPPVVANREFDKWVIVDGENVINFTEFNLQNAVNTTLTLQPIYKDVYVNYSIIADLSNASINKISQSGLVALSNTLSFEIELNSSVSNSKLNITTTSGTVESFKENNIYYVTVSNFLDNFNVYINNITTNSYLITYINETETLTYNQLYGDTLITPAFTKVGYTLVGFKDASGTIYTSEHKIVRNLELYPIWELNTYTVTFPASNGMYVITYNGEHLTNGKNVLLNHGQPLKFEITLSRAYSNSNISVYAETANKNITPSVNENTFTFSEVTTNFNIVITNVVLNTYTLSVDGKNCGNFGYGSWIEVKNNSVVVSNTLTGTNVTFNTLIADENFGGWILNDSEVLTNSFIQDIEINGNVNIKGNYSKQLTRIQLVLNGGTCEVHELVLVEDEQPVLPTPVKNGYQFAGWFTKLVEINTIVDETQSEQFNYLQQSNSNYIVIFAGWKLNK